MLDATLRKWIDPPLDRAGAALVRIGLHADAVTLIGLGFGLVAAILIAVGWFGLALLPLALGRIADGMDGAVARASGGGTDFGGYLDITSDFAFYAAIPMAFILVNPATNGIAGAMLLAAFYINGASFLGFAVFAAKRSMETTAQGVKSLYYSNGLLEGTETILFFVAFCLFPAQFPVLAILFAGLCLVTTVLRLWAARQVFSN
ncbi:CDP-alcohol phosphatidyltransferase family protein [Loktanella sp. IMCC34160]|uniref:CDP-alcohol phosphatidyltransferase family protein n=1 Tax=Loktanella sp. IMCC34160 TaxID=2510646 RepID=UPI00101D81FC|nr:CDP-alcohol phosphatidyltransferase family protein [Loktanella sp. IMCC34160]RYG91422.1 CDP-alcohol phosphatidyltransferase family protein [Loktanella sp. IMCC34160]